MSTKLTKSLIQPNPITAARYQFNIYEKRVMYHLIAQLQREMRGEIDIPRSIFDDRYFDIPYSLIDSDQKNYKKVRDSLEEMRRKSFQIIRKENSWTGFGFINWFDLREGIIKISLPPLIAPALLDISEGFTAFGAMIAATLQSVYSMRFYEWCCQFKDTGKWHTTPDEIRARLGLEDHKSYENYANLKAKVIDVAMKELHGLYEQGLSDVRFEVTETRAGRGRGGSVTKMVFTIYWKKKNEVIDAERNEDYLVVAHFLAQYYNANTADQKLFKDTVLRRCLDENRLEMAAKLVMIAKTKNNPAAYFRTALRDQTGIDSQAHKPSTEEKKAEWATEKKVANRTVKMQKEGRSGETKIGDLFSQPVVPIGGHDAAAAADLVGAARKLARTPKLSK